MDGSGRDKSPPVTPRPRTKRSNVCTQCRRMKQRCDRNTPCSNCVRRFIPHLCHLQSRPPSQPRSAARPAGASPTSSPQAGVIAVASQSGHRYSSATSRQADKSGRQLPLAQYISSRIGQLWNSRGAPSYHGSSYFGHQSAASMMQIESPELPPGVTSFHASRGRKGMHRDEKSPYDHIWELVGYLPRRKAVVDHLVRRYFDELNPVHDCVHEDGFMANYSFFWDRKWGDDDLTAVDLRWLAVLFIMIAFAELLNCPEDASSETQKICEETSVQYFWACRKAIVLAPTFSGENPDLVRAGILVSYYLTYFGRKTESWLTCSFAIRMAQAQGMHIDAESWGLPAQQLETRRRLWCKLHCLDRSISLAVGRPYTIHDKHCMVMKIRNIWLDDKTADEAAVAQELPIDNPTRNMYYMLQQRLSTIFGDIHDECFGLAPVSATSYSSYEKVLNLDKVLLSWAESLPPYFKLDCSDTALDELRPYLYWQRVYLHSAYHFARITLHRTYVLLESITDRYQYSRDACISSACADLKLKLGFRNVRMADRLKAGGAMHNLFNSALVLGIIVVREPFSPKTMAIVEDLTTYCEKQRADMWVNEFVLAEVKVVEMCIASARKSRRDEPSLGDRRVGGATSQVVGSGSESSHSANFSRLSQGWTPAADLDSLPSDFEGIQGTDDNWLDNWFGPLRNFTEPINFQFWEDLVGNVEFRQH